MTATDLAEDLVLSWAHVYTRGLDDRAGQHRLAELASDCHEQRHWGVEVGASSVAIATSMVARTLAGMPADLLWRQGQLATSRDRSPNPRGRPMGRWIKDNWWLVLAGGLGVATTVLGVGLPFEDRTLGSVFGGIAIAGLGLTMLAGIAVRRRHRVVGDYMIAAGTLPAYPFVWTIVLPVLGLLVLVPAIVDAHDVHARGSSQNDATDTTRPRPGDRVLPVLAALVVAGVVAALVVGTTDVAFALLSPTVALLVAHLATRQTRRAPLARLGLTGIVTGIVHTAFLVAMLLLGDDGAVSVGEGPVYLANGIVAAIGTGGLVAFVVGSIRSRGQARPA